MMTQPARHVYSEKYPPITRHENELGAIECEIRLADGGTIGLDPNTAIQSALLENFVLGAPYVPSAISGELGYLYRDCAVEVPMTEAEIYRFFRRSLHPVEFFALAEKFGVFYEISGTFYDDETGFAFSPCYTSGEEIAREAEAQLPQLLVVEDDAGLLRPHSILNFAIAERCMHDLLARDSISSAVIRLQSPTGAVVAPLRAFNNIVALRARDGALVAYGPFGDAAEAIAYVPAGEVRRWGDTESNFVNSTFVCP